MLSAPPDGYTIGCVAPNNAINASLYEKLPFDFVRDSVPVGGTILLSNVLVVHPSVPADSVAQFIAYLKANPGKVSFASAGTGASPHMSAELFMAMTGTKMTHVTYRGAAPNSPTRESHRHTFRSLAGLGRVCVMARYRRSVTRIGANRPRRAERQQVAASRAKPSATMGAAFVESAYIEIIVMSGIDRPRAVH